jgi:3-oxoacyl-[acyl-carrier protein] reductase
MSLEGEVALVTGASRGIGQAIALTLGRDGARVIGTATTQAGADAISSALEQAGVRGQGATLDVTRPDSVDRLLKELATGPGSPAILVNNAGITRDNLLIRMKDEDWQVIIETNLSAIFRLSRAVLRAMLKARHGRIISIGSIVGALGNAGQCNYAAAKAGVGGFTRSLAREVAPRNITVNMVAPGFIDTDMTRVLGDTQKDALLAQIPAGRLGQAQDIAEAVAFLASARAAYITGTTIDVNGGMYMN